MAEVLITVRKNGSYRVEAPEDVTIKMVDHDGNVIPIPKIPFSLCRCGASARKPFCDGTHARIGFDADAVVVVPEAKM